VRLRYTPRARGDLGSIFDYLSERNPLAAYQVKVQIVHTVGLLADFPDLGTDRPHLEVRALGVAGYAYTIYYLVEGDDVWVLHIRDDRRRPLKPGEV
jgi:plasmid stabilization system protein ParE